MFNDGGKAMAVGKRGEERVLEWLRYLQRTSKLRDVIDMRDFRISQRLDMDCGIESLDHVLSTAEIKTDNLVHKSDNFLFELFRINYSEKPDKVFYLGWAFRSPAKYLLYYSPQEDIVYLFRFNDIRMVIAAYAKEKGRQLRDSLKIVLTDDYRMTVNLLVPKSMFRNKVRAYNLSGIKPLQRTRPA